MADIKKVTPTFSVAPQLGPDDMRTAAADGFVLVVNNRPDGEVPEQPSAEIMRRAAEAAGLAYVHIPVRGAPTPDQVAEMKARLNGAHGPALAYCRSGTRSITAWALGRRPEEDRDAILKLARAAGYDLSGSLG